MLDTFQKLGRDMYLTGLVSSHTGALSVRQGDNILVTRRGTMLGQLEADDLVEVPIEGELPDGVADDAPIHLAISFKVTLPSCSVFT